MVDPAVGRRRFVPETTKTKLSFDARTTTAKVAPSCEVGRKFAKEVVYQKCNILQGERSMSEQDDLDGRRSVQHNLLRHSVPDECLGVAYKMSS